MHRSFFRYWVSLGFLVAFATNAWTQTVDTERSIVHFSIKNMKVNTIKGSFLGLHGNLAFAPDSRDLSALDVCLEVSSLKTGNEQRDAHLLSADFFDVEQFSRICYQAKRIEKQADGSFLAHGILTIKGIQREVVVPIFLEGIHLKAEFTIRRLDFGVGEDYGGFTAGKEVQLSVSLYYHEA